MEEQQNEHAADQAYMHPNIVKKLQQLNECTLPSIKVQTRGDFIRAFRKQKSSVDKKSLRHSPKSVFHIPTPTEGDVLDGGGFHDLDSDSDDDDIPPWLNHKLLDAYEREFETQGTAEAVKYMNRIRRLYGCSVRQSDDDLSNYILLLEFMYCTIPDLFLPEPAQLANARSGSDESPPDLGPSSTTDISHACGVENEFTKETYASVCARNKERFVALMNRFAYYNFFTDGACLKRRNYDNILEKHHPFFVVTSALFGPNREFLLEQIFKMPDHDRQMIEHRVERVMQSLTIEMPRGAFVLESQPKRDLHRCDRLFFKGQETLLEHVVRRQRDRSYEGYFGAVQNGEIVDFKLLVDYRKEKDAMKESGSPADGDGSNNHPFGESTEVSDETVEEDDGKEEEESGDDDPADAEAEEVEESEESETEEAEIAIEEEEPIVLGRMDYSKDQLWDFIDRLQKELEEKEEEEKEQLQSYRSIRAKSEELHQLLKSENTLLKQHTDKMTRLTERLTSDKEKLVGVCNRLRARVERYKMKDERMREAVEELRSIENAVAKYDELAVTADAQAAKIKEIEEERDAQLHENRKLQREVDSKQDWIKTLEQKRLKLEATEKTHLEQISVMKKLQEGGPDGVQEYYEDLAKERAEELEQEKILSKQKDEAIKQLQENEKRWNRKNERMGQIDLIEEELERETLARKEAEQKTQSINAELADQRAKVEKLLFEKNQAKDKTKAQLRAASQLTEDAQTKKNELEGRLKQAENNVEKLRSEIAVLQNTRLDNEKTIAKLEAYKSLNHDGSDMKAVNYELGKRLKQAEIDAENLSREIKSLESKLSQQEQKIVKLEKDKDIIKLQFRVEKEKAVNVAVEKKGREMAGKLEELRSKVKQADHELFEKEKRLLQFQATSNAVQNKPKELEAAAAKAISTASDKKNQDLTDKLIRKEADYEVLKKEYSAKLRQKQADAEKWKKENVEFWKKKEANELAARVELEEKLKKQEMDLAESHKKNEEGELKHAELTRKVYHAEEQLLVKEEEMEELRKEIKQTRSSPTTAVPQESPDDVLDGILTPLENSMAPRRLSGKLVVDNTKFVKTMRHNIQLQKKLFDVQSKQL